MTKPTKLVHWRKSSQCGSNTCVEVARDGDRVLVRDSKDPERAPLEFTPAEWTAFLHGARDGEFDFA